MLCLGGSTLGVLVGKVCWPLCCQGRAEGISFPLAQERAKGSLPDLQQLLFPNWDNSNSGLPRRGLSDKLVSTVGRQHLPVGSYTLFTDPHTPCGSSAKAGAPGEQRDADLYRNRCLTTRKGTLSLLHSQHRVPDSRPFNCPGTCLSNLTLPTRALPAQPGPAAAPILPSSPAEALCWPANICPFPSPT